MNLSPELLLKTTHIFLFTYIFLLFFPHTTSLREISFWLAFLSWITLRAKRPGPFIPLNPVIVSLSVFVLITLLASLLGEGPSENLRKFKGEIFTVFILFLITVTEYHSLERIKKILLSPIAAYAVCTVLIIIESFMWGPSYFTDLLIRDKLTWLGGYTEKGTILFPLTIGYFLIARNNLRYLLLVLIPVSFGIIATHMDFTALVAAILIILLCAFFAYPKNYRTWLKTTLLVFLIVFAAGVYMSKDTVMKDDFKLKFNMIMHPIEELNKPGGLTNRMPMWRAAVDVVKERPLLGYGWGMQKYGKIAVREQFMKIWETENPHVHNMYTYQNKDNFISPHNMVVELAIQSGLLGVVSFFAFIGIYIFYLLRAAVRADNTERNLLIIIVGGALLSFMIINLMDDDVWKTSWRLLFVVLGCGMAKLNKE